MTEPTGESDAPKVWTADDLMKLEMIGPVRFADYDDGSRQDYEAVGLSRFGYSWERRGDKPERTFYTVDWAEVADFEEAARRLSQPPDPASPREVWNNWSDRMHASPRMAYSATRVLNDAECNAGVHPVGQHRSWMRRADNAWHQGMNAVAAGERGRGLEQPGWLYDVKTAAHELYRLQYLWRQDRSEDTGLVCALGQRCRDCSILQTIQATMEEAKTRQPFPRGDLTDVDIDLAKTWTCIGHVLSSEHAYLDGTIVSSERDRKNDF